MDPAEYEVMRRVSVEAFGGRAQVGLLIQLLHDSWAWDDQLSFVAMIGNELVGQVLYTHAVIDAAPRQVDVLVLSPIGVRPDWQDRGVGTHLIEESLAIVSGRSEPLVFLEGHPGLYRRFGFRKASDLGFAPPSNRIPAEAFMVLTLPLHESWMIGALVYPDAFWLADAVGLRPDS